MSPFNQNGFRWAWMLVVLLALALPSAAQGAGKLACGQSEHHFGEVEGGLTVKHEFVLTNTGDEVITVKKVSTSCGCTAAKLSSEQIEPGGEVRLPVEVRLPRRAGKTRKRVTIVPEDEGVKSLRLYLSAEVVQPVRLMPSKVFFGHVQPGQEFSKTVDVSIQSETPVVVRSATLEPSPDRDDDHQITAELDPVVQGSFYRVKVDLAVGKKLGRLERSVVLRTDSRSYPTLRVPVSAVVGGALTFTPQEIVVPTGAAGAQPLTRYLIVSRSRAAGSEGPFDITKVIPPSEDMEIQVQRLGKLGYRIRVGGVVPSEKLSDASLEIETDVAEMPKFSVPFRLLDRGGS